MGANGTRGRDSDFKRTERMIVTTESAKANSCNFCKRGEYNGVTLIYPYETVVHVSTEGGGIAVRFCDNCMDELIGKVEKLKNEPKE